MGSTMDDNRIIDGDGDAESETAQNEEKSAEMEGSIDVEALKRALAEEEASVKKYMANWQRAQADFVNYKRRTEQEKADIIKSANAGLILNLLSVVDDMERALEHVSDKLAGSKWVDGIVLIYRKFMAILEVNGVSEMKALGKTFDPSFHEAVGHVEGKSDKIITVVQKGYMLNDKVLRPAKVMVGDGRSSASRDEIEKDE